MELLGGLELFATSRGFDNPIDLILPFGSQALHDHILHMVGIRHAPEKEMVFFRSSLNLHIAEIENGRYHAVHLRGDVLDTREFQLTDCSDEEPLLLDIDDALIGDDPDIKKVVDPDEEGVEPDEEYERILDEESKSGHFRPKGFWIEERNDRERAKDDRNEQDSDEEVCRDIEPVSVNDTEHDLILSLTLEVITAEVVI